MSRQKEIQEGFQTVLRVSTVLFGQFPSCPDCLLDSFQTLRKLSRPSGDYPDCVLTFQIVRPVSRLSRWLPDYQEGPECFQTFQTVFTVSVKYSYCPDTFQTVQTIFHTVCVDILQTFRTVTEPSGDVL